MRFWEWKFSSEVQSKKTGEDVKEQPEEGDACNCHGRHNILPILVYMSKIQRREDALVATLLTMHNSELTSKAIQIFLRLLQT